MVNNHNTTSFGGFLCVFLCLASLCNIRYGFAADPESNEIFSEVAKATGLDFVHFNGMSGEFYFAEPIGGGVALFDYDNDGDLDVYLTQGHMLGAGKTLADALFPPEPGRPLTDRLFRNDLQIGPDGTRSPAIRRRHSSERYPRRRLRHGRSGGGL